jgi:hypothetical protein
VNSQTEPCADIAEVEEYVQYGICPNIALKVVSIAHVQDVTDWPRNALVTCCRLQGSASPNGLTTLNKSAVLQPRLDERTRAAEHRLGRKKGTRLIFVFDGTWCVLSSPGDDFVMIIVLFRGFNRIKIIHYLPLRVHI